jgi:hypothetical protein
MSDDDPRSDCKHQRLEPSDRVALQSGDADPIGLGRKVPGFGGFYLDSQEKPVIYLRGAAQRADAERALAPYLASQGLSPSELRVLPTRFDWEQLESWSALVSAQVLALPGGVFVDTDEGITGTTIGFAAAAGAIEQLGGLLVGKDPRGVTSLWHRMVSVAFKAGNAGPIKGAISAIDCALWDIRAKANGVPLYRELGGSSPTARAYASGLDSPLDDEELVSSTGGWPAGAWTRAS